MRAHFTDQVAGRTAMATELLRPERAPHILEQGLLPDDLLTIRTAGEEAEKQDRLQREDLATQKFALDALCKARSDVDDEADALRARLPAVHLDLAAYPATAELAGWLASASFDRFRIRLVKPVTTGATPVEPPKAQRELVTRTDRLSRALAAAQFATALLAAERGPIAEALERRAFPRTRLESFAKAARALADKLGGKVTMEGSQHTQLEAAAVAAQTARWKACRKMIARVAKSDPQLATLWAAC